LKVEDLETLRKRRSICPWPRSALLYSAKAIEADIVREKERDINKRLVSILTNQYYEAMETSIKVTSI